MKKKRSGSLSNYLSTPTYRTKGLELTPRTAFSLKQPYLGLTRPPTAEIRTGKPTRRQRYVSFGKSSAGNPVNRILLFTVIGLLAATSVLIVALMQRNPSASGGITMGGEGDTGSDGGGDGGDQTVATGIAFLNGADGISKVGSPYTTIDIKYYPNWNWTATSALLIKNLDETPHTITITYESTVGDMSNVDKMFCCVYTDSKAVMFYAYYDGGNKVTNGTWTSLGGGDILTLKISTLGLSGSGSFGVNFQVSYE